jgi:hypothetical protein
MCTVAIQQVAAPLEKLQFSEAGKMNCTAVSL